MGTESTDAPPGHPPRTRPGRREPSPARGKPARRSPAGNGAPGTSPFPSTAPAYLQRLHQQPHIGFRDAQRDAQRRGHHDEPEHHGHPHGAHLPQGPHHLHGAQGRAAPAPALKARGRPGPPRSAPPRPAAAPERRGRCAVGAGVARERSWRAGSS